MYPDDDLQQDLPIEQDHPVGDEQSEATVEATESTSEPAGDDTPDEKPQSRFDKRIGQLTGENYALKSDRDYWRNRALTEAPEAAKPAVVAVESPKPPKLEDFDHDIDRYTDALGEYTEKSIEFQANAKAVEITEQGQQARASEAKQAVAKQRAQQWNERSVEFAKEHDDYFDIVQNPTLNISQDMSDVLAEMDHGPAVAYHLGKNTEVAFRISQKDSPAAVAFALADIGRKVLADNPKLVSTNESDAPEPPSTIGTGRSTIKGKDPTNAEHTAKMGTDEWIKRRTTQVRKRTNG